MKENSQKQDNVDFIFIHQKLLSFIVNEASNEKGKMENEHEVKNEEINENENMIKKIMNI